MSSKTKSRWEAMRTPETRKVERLLRSEYPNADAYRYNSASIRIRVVDPRFEGKTREQRDAMIEPYLSQLPETTQGDIMNLLMLAPGEAESSINARYSNSEFEDPSPSEL